MHAVCIAHHAALPHSPPQVLQFVKGEEYARFTRIVFDTAPTGHTLRLLTVGRARGVGSVEGMQLHCHPRAEAVRSLAAICSRPSCPAASTHHYSAPPPHKPQVPDFVEASLAKITRLRRKLSSASQVLSAAAAELVQLGSLAAWLCELVRAGLGTAGALTRRRSSLHQANRPILGSWRRPSAACLAPTAPKMRRWTSWSSCRWAAAGCMLEAVDIE